MIRSKMIPRYRQAFAEADAKTREAVGDNPRHELGFCFVFWDKKKEILLRDYNIDWKTPAELNPNVIYD